MNMMSEGRTAVRAMGSALAAAVGVRDRRGGEMNASPHLAFGAGAPDTDCREAAKPRSREAAKPRSREAAPASALRP